jgi:hypothetical protein
MLDPSQQLLVQLFRLMRDNMDIVSVLVGPNGDLKFINRFKRMVKEQYLTALKEAECTGKERCFDFFASFVVSALSGCLRYGSRTDDGNAGGSRRTGLEGCDALCARSPGR